jgi:DNA-binding GntR family transcriptional regulator
MPWVQWRNSCKQRARALRRDPKCDHARVVDAVACGDAAAAGSARQHPIDLAFNDTRASLQAQSVAGDRIS